MAHLPLFKSSSFNFLVLQVQPRHRHKLKNLDLILSAKAEEQNAAKKGVFPVPRVTAALKLSGLQISTTSTAQSLLPSPMPWVWVQDLTKNMQREWTWVSKIEIPCKTGSISIQFPQNGEGDQRVKAKPLTTSQVCLHPPIWHLHREKWYNQRSDSQSQSANVSPCKPLFEISIWNNPIL